MFLQYTFSLQSRVARTFQAKMGIIFSRSPTNIVVNARDKNPEVLHLYFILFKELPLRCVRRLSAFAL